MKVTRVVSCPNCEAKLQIRSSKNQGKCPKCGTGFRFPAKTPSAAQPPIETVHTQIASKPIEEPIGFGAFVSQYFRATRGSLILWLLVVSLVCVIATFLKPIVGFTSLVVACVLFCVISAGLAFLFLIGRISEFFFRKSKALPAKPKSTMSALAFGSGLVALGLAAIASVEFFAPDKGLLAANIESVEKFQDALHDTVTKTFSSSGLASSSEPSGSSDSASNVGSSEQSLASSTRTTNNQESENVSASDFLPSESQTGHDVVSSKGTEDADVNQSGFGNSKSSRQQLSSTQLPSSSRNVESDKARQNEELVSIEVALGLDGRKTSDLLVTDTACEPGGSYYEPLRVPVGTILWGGPNVAPEPGGPY